MRGFVSSQAMMCSYLAPEARVPTTPSPAPDQSHGRPGWCMTLKRGQVLQSHIVSASVLSLKFTLQFSELIARFSRPSCAELTRCTSDSGH